MKKLKCESCGGDIEVDESKNLAVCPFCKTKYQLNEKKEIYLRVDEDIKKMTMDAFERNKKVSKIVAPIFIVIFVIVFCIIGYTIYQGVSGTSSFDVSRFNSSFELYKGTENKSSVGNLLDEVVTNNKKNKDKQITVVFGEVSTTDPDEIVAIKKDLKSMLDAEYEIGFEYDKKGFINKVTIEETDSIIKDYKDKYDEAVEDIEDDDEEKRMDEFDEQIEKARETIENMS